jgi:hypothetical protein
VTANSLLYLYGIVPADAPEPPAELRGIEDGAVFLLRAGGVAGIVGRVPAESYAEDVLESRLADLGWVGERGIAHEQVLNWFADRGPVVPLTPFSLHRDEERVRQRLEELGEGFHETLLRLRGRREWGVKLWRTPDAAEHLRDFSAPLRALEQEIATASPGRRYLIEKKRDGIRAEELRSFTVETSRQLFVELARQAEQAKRLPLPATGDAGTARALALHAAFLVPDEAFTAFQERLSALAARYAEAGFECEFTGPWPPYHFAEP